ncbi:KAP family P-loop NTPase fold protein [Empedobacter brevis]|nr:P-loop NTPase fold protein [Empedobacter brevis]
MADILIFLTLLFLCYWVYSKIKIKFYLKKDYIIYSLLSVFIYGYIRYSYSDDLLGMNILSKVKYFDFFLLLAIVPIILIVSFWYFNRGKEKENKKSDFYDDNPINCSEEDILNRKQKAIQVARLIKGNKSKTSLAIGIVGEWGNGKTSFMNFIEESFVDEKDYIIVHFNSWLNISINSIINDFFNTIEKKISIYSIDISKELKKYGNNVLSINKNSTTETLLNAINIIPENSLSDNFENLNTLLNKLDKKVIVFFDDIDRLQPNEVFEVLKLIRNTASFDVFSYVVGYDKAYLNIALEKNNIPFSDRYYEKIFLKEFPLSPIKQEDINDFIKKGILLFETEKEEELESFFNLYNILNFNGENVFESISNIRNAKRFLNELKLSIENIKDDIYLHDFILIKLLKFSYYDVYRLLFNKNNYLENSKYERSGINQYTHYKLKKKDSKEGGINSFSKSILNEDVKSLGIFSKSELSIIGFICERIFGDGYGPFNTKQNAITYGHNYYRYFEDELSESNISNAEFNDFMTKSLEEKKEFVDDVYKNDRLIGLTLFLYKVKIHKDLKSKEEYENFIKILLYIGRLKSNERIFKYQGIDFDFLYNCMNNYNNVLINKFGYSNIQELKIFFKSLFYVKKEFYDFETDFVKFLYDSRGSDSSLNTPFNKQEIDEYLVYCFDNNSKLINGIDEKFWDCYQLCFVNDWEKESENRWGQITKIINENRDKLIYDIIPKYYNEFFMYCIKPQDYYGEEKNSFKIGLPIEVINKLFDSFEGFILYLESDKFRFKIEEPFDFLEEFILFVKEFNITKQNIDFEFKHQPVNEMLDQIKLKWNRN